MKKVFRTPISALYVYLRRHGSTTIQNNFGKFFYRLSWHQKFWKKKSFNFESKCFSLVFDQYSSLPIKDIVSTCVIFLKSGVLSNNNGCRNRDTKMEKGKNPAGIS